MFQRTLIVAMYLIGCAPAQDPNEGAMPCAEGMIVSCACPSGDQGSQGCEAGRFSPCVCADEMLPAPDAMSLDAAALADAALTHDAGLSNDAAETRDATVPKDAEPTPDAAAPPPAPVVCESLDVIDFFSEAEGIDGRWHLRLDAPETMALEPADCGGGEDAVVIGFRAPYDGYWLLDTGGPQTRFDPVLRSHVGCPDQEPAETCIDDDTTFAPVIGGYLAAGEVRHFVVSAWTGVPTTLDLIAERLPLVEGGAACTDGERVACDAAHTCVPDENAPDSSICEVRTPPILERVTAYRQDEDIYTLSLEGRDESRDIWGLAIQYLDIDDAPIALGGDTTFYAGHQDAPHTQSFRLGFRFSGLRDIPGVAKVRVAAVDANGAESAFEVAEFDPIPEVMQADPCDPDFVRNICPNSFTCHQTTALCGPARTPTITDGGFYLNREEATWGLVVEGIDRNADVVAIRFLVLDRRRQRIQLDGADVGDLVVGDRIEHQGDTWRFSHSGMLPRSVDPSEVGYLQLIAIDQTNLASDDAVFPIGDAPQQPLGAPCDSLLALDRCPRGARCQNDALGNPVCRMPFYACPPGADLPALTVGEPVTGGTFGADASAGHVSCATGLVGIAGYRFVAPETGNYTVDVNADFAAINYVTRGCLSVRYDDELVCEVGGAPRGTLSMQAGQEVYLRIGGVFASQDVDVDAYKNSRGTYQLTIERQP